MTTGQELIQYIVAELMLRRVVPTDACILQHIREMRDVSDLRTQEKGRNSDAM